MMSSTISASLAAPSPTVAGRVAAPRRSPAPTPTPVRLSGSASVFRGQALSVKAPIVSVARDVRVAVTAAVGNDAPGGRRGGRGGREEQGDGFEERVVQVRRVTKVVKGGKQLSFRAVVVAGDKKGSVGVGCAAAKEVVTAVQKAAATARAEAIKVPITRGETFPHRVEGRHGAARVMLRPAAEGCGVIAGGATRVVMELAGIRNAFGKQLGTANALNNARATVEGLSRLRTWKQVADNRGVTVSHLMGLDGEEKSSQ